MALTKIQAAGLTADLIDETKLADNSIDSEHYNDGSIDNEHLADDAVGVAELSATGTASNTTFLRGDNSWVTPTDTNTVYTHPNHSGEVTSTADGAQVVADDIIDEANLKVDNSPTDDHVLTAKASAAGGLTWAAASGGATINNATANELVTVASTTTQLDAESNLTFDGSDLSVTGRILVGTTALGSNADDLCLSTAANTGISIKSGTSSTGNIYFADGTSGTDLYRGYASYSHSDDSLALGTANTTRLALTANGAAITGRQTISAQPAFRASLTSNVSATNTIIFNSQQYEQGGDNYDPTTGIFTCPVAGLYMFIAACTSTNASGGKQIMMYKNADAIGRVYAGNNTNDHQALPLTVVQTFAANDTCSVKCTAGAIYGSTGSASQHSQFMGYLLG